MANRWENIKGIGLIFEREGWYSIQYSARVDGKKRAIRESAHTRNRNTAIGLLRKRAGEVDSGKAVGPRVTRTSFHDLKKFILDNYEISGLRSLRSLRFRIAHLEDYFGGYLAQGITSERVEEYKKHRKDQGAANASINRELAALRRMFSLALKYKRVNERPYIEMLTEANARKGFFDDAQFETLLTELPDYLKAPVETAFITGWRIASELLVRRQNDVDLERGLLRIDPNETKNGDGREVALTPRLRTVLSAQLDRTRAFEKASGQIVPWLFHRNGRRIKNFTTAWVAACKRAGVVGRIPHDLRRTAVRNLERAGVPRSVAMSMVGHRTLTMYSRYAISDLRAKQEAAAKLAALDEQRAASKAQRKVVPIVASGAA